MASCPELYQCGLHRKVSMKEALRVWQSFYCEGAYARCERFKLTTAGVTVPEKLLPNGRLVDAPAPDALVGGG
ncbi:MAG TPA: hypothetical protein VIW03_14525 [Anaeromyxobacter sp.]